uniref:DUF975 family protein n=1 Tax=Candidatus Enterococcus willemsii TaxID=1857215 RepID=UPI00403F1F43
MKTNAELKAEAKALLQNRWKESILMCLIPTLLTILTVIATFIIIGTLLYFFFIFFQDYMHSLESSSYVSTDNGGSSGSNAGGLISGLIAAFFTAGISWTFLDVYRGRIATIRPFKDLVRGFRSPYALGIVVIYLLSVLFTFLWSLLLIIPGIIKSYAYSQANYIFYETYENTGEVPRYLDTITASRQIMDGHKGQLFLLDLSFIGWHFLCWLTLGIGYIWLNPYIYATKSIFYANLPKE